MPLFPQSSMVSGLLKTVEAVSVYQNYSPLYFQWKRPLLRKQDDGGKAVRALKKAVDFRGSLCKGAEHNRPVGNGFITGNCDFAPERALMFFSSINI